MTRPPAEATIAVRLQPRARRGRDKGVRVEGIEAAALRDALVA